MTAESTAKKKTDPDKIPASSSRNVPRGGTGKISSSATGTGLKGQEKAPKIGGVDGLRHITFIAPEPPLTDNKEGKDEDSI